MNNNIQNQGVIVMKNTNPRHILVLAALALVMVFSLTAPAALAANGTFDVTVAHNINGRSLGLSKDLPVNITIEKMVNS
jgi:hypothetical protein